MWGDENYCPQGEEGNINWHIHSRKQMIVFKLNKNMSFAPVYRPIPGYLSQNDRSEDPTFKSLREHIHHTVHCDRAGGEPGVPH